MAATTRRRLNEYEDELFEKLSGTEGNASVNDSILKTVLKLTTCGAAGIMFGMSLEKGRVFEPLAIRDQMTMDRFMMVKMFLSAVTSGMFSLSILSMIPATQRKFQKASRAFISGFSDKGFVSTCLGAGILGAGMTISGACPGMVLVQVGAGVPNAFYTLGGALVGALLYGFIEPAVVSLTKPKQPYKQHYLHKYLNSPFFIVALPFGAMMAAVVFGLELFAPWKSELPKGLIDTGSSILTRTAWPPFIAGSLIGFQQIPVLLAVDDTLGSSSSYCTVVAQLLVSKPMERISPYLCKFKTGFSNWWQVIFIGGAIGGAYWSATASGAFGQCAGVSATAAFSGGVLMLLGSRIGARCTSGHGLSGMGLLSFISMVAVPAMFMGGIITAAIMKI